MKALVLILVLACATVTHAADLTAEAEQAFLKQDWQKATNAYKAVVAADAQNAQAWFRLGASHHALGKYSEAIAAYEKANGLGYMPGQVAFRLARAHAASGRNDDAFKWLNAAVPVGFSQQSLLYSEKDLRGLLDDKRLEEVLAAMNRAAHPCLQSPEYRQFDFWLGEWDVKNAQQQIVAQSSIQLILDQCVILENYTNAAGYSGKSFNSYFAQGKRWEQTWVDTTGDIHHYEGGLKDGAMVLTRSYPLADGTKATGRMIFTKEGTDAVRQRMEQSADGGKTWSMQFDGLYVRRK